MHYQTNKKFTLIFALLICVSQVFSSLHGMLAPQKTDYKKIFFNYLQNARSQLMSKLPSAKSLVSKKALGAAIIAMLAMLYYWEQNCFSESTNRNPAVSFESL